MADTTNRLAGVATIQIDGTAYKLAGDLAYSVSQFTRTTVTGQDAVHGYKEEPIAGYIAGTIRDSNGLSVADLNAMTNVTVNLALANGKNVIGRNMWTVEHQENKTTEATIEVRWEGFEVVEA